MERCQGNVKMCMKLADLPEGANIFVDANILIYHFSRTSLGLPGTMA
jgi:hypothetical protein